jgi:ribosomal protein S6E (S10)
MGTHLQPCYTPQQRKKQKKCKLRNNSMETALTQIPSRVC